jgi:FlaA1/EpsC-like NDP-sugar epimerase
MAIFAKIYSIFIFSFMKKILITGGAGFIGSHVVRRFVLQYPHY